MDALMVVIAAESPLLPDLALLMARHTADMHAQTPPESIHMMDAGQLAIPEVSFFVMRDHGNAIGMGAFKRLSATHGEIKSMHILHETRGRGLSKAMLSHLMDAARSAGLTRLSLETGAEPIFAPARGLYERAGFAYCPPFEGYTLDPNSVFMTKTLA
jgi:putative acetyltransferase